MKASSNPGDVILDPFLGSGTTAEVAMRLGRFFVGFELNKAYCNIAIKRLEGSVAVATSGPRTKRKRESKTEKEKGEKEGKKSRDV